jgi:hypothetical protein
MFASDMGLPRSFGVNGNALPDAATTGPLVVEVQAGPAGPSSSTALPPVLATAANTSVVPATSTVRHSARNTPESHASDGAAEPEIVQGTNRRTTLPRLYSYHQQVVQRERQRQRHYAQRRRQAQQSLTSWIWLKVCLRMRKSTVEFFDAVDAGRVDVVRDMVRAQPNLLLHTRPGTRWTAAHYAAERGEYATLTALFEEAQITERAAQSARSLVCASGSSRFQDRVKRMVNSLTEKNLTPLMLACKRGCAFEFVCPLVVLICSCIIFLILNPTIAGIVQAIRRLHLWADARNNGR